MWDGCRRNRNLGTAKSGRGATNRFAIPERWTDLSVYWQKLARFVAVEKSIGSHTIAFLVEPTRRGWLHHCTVDDVLRVLRLAAANRYADEFRRELQASKRIPFDAQYDRAAMQADRLDPAWFARPDRKLRIA